MERRRFWSRNDGLIFEFLLRAVRSRWRRLQARFLYIFFFKGLFLLSPLSLSLSRFFLFLPFDWQVRVPRHEEPTWAQKAPEYLCHGKVEESRDLDCVPQAAFSLCFNVRNICFRFMNQHKGRSSLPKSDSAFFDIFHYRPLDWYSRIFSLYF